MYKDVHIDWLCKKQSRTRREMKIKIRENIMTSWKCGNYYILCELRHDCKQ